MLYNFPEGREHFFNTFVEIEIFAPEFGHFEVVNFFENIILTTFFWNFYFLKRLSGALERTKRLINHCKEFPVYLAFEQIHYF